MGLKSRKINCRGKLKEERECMEKLLETNVDKRTVFDLENK